MSETSEAPKKIWLEYTPHEQYLHLTDELVWTGYLTEYVRADYHERLVEALRNCIDDAADIGYESVYNEEARDLLSVLEAEKRGG